MMFGSACGRFLPGAAFALAAFCLSLPAASSAVAQTATSDATSMAQAGQLSAFAQAVATAAARDPALAAFYRSNGYTPIWTGAGDADRRAAFLAAIANAGEQGLPAARYDRAGLVQKFHDVQTERDLGDLEVQMSRDFLQYARDVQTGVLVPSQVDPNIVRQVPQQDPLEVITRFVKSDPAAFLAELPPQAPEYNRLLKEEAALETRIADGGWGAKVVAKALKPGQSGGPVVALRDRLIAMGYLPQTASAEYDDALKTAVVQFQADHGLTPDGIAAGETIAEVNVEPVQRLKSVIVALERERWMNFDLGKRHIWVNLADFSAKVIDDGKVTFETPAVVGRVGKDTSTPEFSDHVRFMIVNPTWNVPRSIVVKEYLPAMQKNPNADGQLTLIDSHGQKVDRSSVDFSQYNADTFPFALKQPPSDGNALGLVKFMFPNKYNIYLHDTPTKYLFSHEVRAFSHGCIRLAKPFDLAYTLLAPQSDNPVATFKAALDTHVETTVELKEPVQVHLVYFTAIAPVKGQMEYRRDIYGRDAEIFAALAKAGVVLGAVQG